MIAHESGEVVVATLDGRAYYFITQLLRHSGIRFSSKTPDEDISLGTRLVLTTRKERTRIKFGLVLCMEDLGSDLGVSKQRLLRVLDRRDDHLIIGIDPGKRTGVAVYYQQREVESSLHGSTEGAIERIVTLLDGSWAGKKTVRIGEGNEGIGKRIAESIVKRFGVSIDVELVDERGTSVHVGRVGGGRVRDQKSAALIALRRGRRFNPLK